MIRTVKYGSEEFAKVLSRSQLDYRDLNEKVEQIVTDVQRRGDAALFEYTAKFDGIELTADTVRVTETEIDAAYAEVDADVLASLRHAAANITAYQTRVYETIAAGQGLRDGTGYVLRPMERAGLYVPGGKASYPSSVMMTALTARAAGVTDIVMATPAGCGINPLTLVAARECGVTAVYKIGGAQAVAALAYGTESIPKCSTVTGPGNIFVTLAKKLVYGHVGIDMIAGPSEILVVADGTARADWLAADMLSQAEHDELASSFLVTTEAEIAEAVAEELEKQIALLPKRDIARKSLADHGAIILADNLDQAVEICNAIAPEHMELCVDDPESLLPRIRNAGAVFLGHYTPEPVGDYFAGPNHVLPTSGAARFSSALGVDAFLKKVSVIRYTESQLAAASDDIIRIAETEQLTAHANSIRIRKGV